MRNASPGATSAATATLNSLRGDGASATVGRVQNGANSAASVKQTAAAPAKPARQLIVGEVPDEEEDLNAKV